MLVVALSAVLVVAGVGIALGAPAVALLLESEDRAKNEQEELVATSA